MRAFFLIASLVLIALSCSQSMAEDTVFVGKTYSPERYEVWSPHASPDEMKVFQAMADEIKSKRGDDKEDDDGFVIKPFTGKLVVQRIMVEIGQQVGSDQPLLTYSFPPEEIQAERRKLSQNEINSMEAGLSRVSTDITRLNIQLDEFRRRMPLGTISEQDVKDKIREIEIARLKERAMRESVNLEKEMNRGELELAKAKFGPKASFGHLPSEAYARSPVKGYVLWSNPDLKPGVILGKKTKLFIVGSMNPLLIRALVHEIKLPKLHVGDKAEVTFESMPGKTFTAIVSRIAMSADETDVQMPSHFQVELTLPNPGIVLKEGLKGQVRLTTPDVSPQGGS